MNSLSTPLAGPRRLILINSGKYAYAELDLTRSLQLVGANGLGKTALIATLQYLYLDSQRDMRFGEHSTDESRRFYLKGDTSCILYECDTPSGPRVLCIRSDGASTGHKLERYTWSGEFRREDFIEDGRPRRWDAITPRLQPQGLTHLEETIDLRRLLGAVDKQTKESWGLVPLTDSRDYPRFRQTFQRLLQLKDIRQDDLKMLLADCAKLAPSERTVNLATEFEKELRAINRDRIEIQMLREAKAQVADVRDLFDQESQARAVAHAGVRELVARYADYAASYNRTLASIQKIKDEAESSLEDLEQKKNTLLTEFKEVAAKEGENRAQLSRLDKIRTRFEEFQVDEECQKLERLGSEISNIEARLQNAPKESADAIRLQLSRKSELLGQRESALEKLKDLLVTWLRQRIPAKQVDQIGALYNRGILELIVDEQVTIKDEHRLIKHLRSITDRCDARGYGDEILSLEFPAGAVRRAAEIGDATHLESEIKSLQRELSNLNTDLETALSMKDLVERLPKARKDHVATIKLVTEYQAYRETLTQETAWQHEGQLLRALLVKLQGDLAENERLRELDKTLVVGALKKFDELEVERKRVSTDASAFPVALGHDPGQTPLGTAFVSTFPLSLPETFAIVREKCRAAERLDSSLRLMIEVLDQRFATASFNYDRSAEIEARLRILEVQIASLQERSQNTEDRWRAVLVSARSGFQAMLKSLEAINKVAKKINTELGRIEFSSISAVNLEVIENGTAVSEYRRQAEDAWEPSLFEMAADADRKMQEFSRILQLRPTISVSDLFALRFRVSRLDGLTNTYDNFDSVESTGTTIVLKVTLNLIVLRDLLIEGRARIPFYLDEVHALDRQNFGNILTLSERLGFVGIYAAPTAASGPRSYVHLVPDSKGNLVVTTAHRKDILRIPSEAAEATSSNSKLE